MIHYHFLLISSQPLLLNQAAKNQEDQTIFADYTVDCQKYKMGWSKVLSK